MNQLNPAAYSKLMDTGEPSNDPKCTKILPATSAAPKYKFVMPTEFVMKHMSHLIEKQLQLVDDNDRAFTVTLIQRRNKDKYEYMLSGWRKYGDVNGIKEGDTVLFEMLNPGVLKVSVISHGAPVVRAPKVPKRKRTTDTDGDDDDEFQGGVGGPGDPAGLMPPPGGYTAGQQAQQMQLGQRQQQQASPSARASPAPPGARRMAAAAAGQAGGTTISPFELVGQPGSPGFGGSMEPPGGPLGQLTALQQQQQQQRQATHTADQLAAALTAVQQLELPPAELLALMHANTASLTDLAPLPSSDLLALMQQQMMAAGGGGGGGPGPGPSSAAGGGPGQGDGAGGKGGAGPLLPPSMAPLVPGMAPLQPTVAELAAVVNQLEKQARGESGAGLAGQQPDSNAPPWEVLLQENVNLREDLQQYKAKVFSLQGTLQNVGRAIQQKTDPGLVAMTGVLNAINQIEAPDFLPPEMPARTRAAVQEVLAELRQQLNSVMHMVWDVRQLSDQLNRELAAEEAAQHVVMAPKPRTSAGL